MRQGDRDQTTLLNAYSFRHSTSKNMDDIVFMLAIRTPLTKAKKGRFKDTELDYLIYSLPKQVNARSRLDPGLIEDICCGNVCSIRVNTCGYRERDLRTSQVADPKDLHKLRAAMLAAGFQHTSGASIINRFCSSGLRAVQDVSQQIMCGSIEIGLAQGAESMTHGADRAPPRFHSEILKVQEAADCMQPMIQTVRLRELSTGRSCAKSGMV
jgi:acetyl-CoA acetyltransferase